MIDANKVGIVGIGNVGATAAYALLLHGLVTELVLLSRDKAKAVGEKLDLEHGLSYLEHASIIATDDYQDLHDCDVVIITAGAAQQPGESRLDLVNKNTAIVEEIIPKVLAAAPEAIIILVSNPVDILTYKANALAGFPNGKIFGSGTMLDTARFRFHLSEWFHVNPHSIHAYILGEHGDSSFPVISSASIGGQPLITHPAYSAEQINHAFTQAKTAAYEIIQAKGATYYAIGVVVVKLVSTILRNAQTILPVSLPLHDYYGLSDISLSVPCVIGKNGVEQVLTVTLNDEEQEHLHKSAETLRSYLA